MSIADHNAICLIIAHLTSISYLGTIFLLCFEDSTLIAIDQHRLESKQTLKDKKKPVISKSSAAQEQEKKEGDWRDFEYGLDLEFSDGGSDDDIESEVCATCQHCASTVLNELLRMKRRS